MLKTLAVILAMALLLLLLMQSSWFKQRITHYLTDTLSRELKVKVDIQNTTIRYFDHIELEHLLIEDRRADTMIYVERLAINYDLFKLNRTLLKFDEANVIGAVVNLGNHDSTGFNLQFLIDYFQPSKPSTTQATVLEIDKISLERSRFRFFNEDRPAPADRAFNENDFRFFDINGKIRNMEIIEDSLHFRIKELNTYESCGLTVNDLSSVVTISRHFMAFDALEFETPRSSADLDLSFSYSKYASFSYFIDSVIMKSTVRSCHITTDELSYFNNTIENIDETISGSVRLEGTTAELNATDANIRLGDHTHFTGNARMKGLPDIYTSTYDIDAISLSSSTEAIDRLSEGLLPPQLMPAGKIHFVGDLTGKLNDMLINGDLKTDLGELLLDIDLANDSAWTYRGNIRSEAFIAGPLLNINELKACAFNITVDGSGDDIGTIHSSLEATVSEINFGNEVYHGLSTKGVLDRGLFTGNFGVNDVHYKLNGSGSVNLADSLKIKAKIIAPLINLYQLGLMQEPTSVAMNADVDLYFNDIEQMAGSVDLHEIEIDRPTRKFRMGDIVIEANFKNEHHDLKLTSKTMEASLAGHYQIADIPRLTNNVLNKIAPEIDRIEDERLTHEDVHATLKLNEFHPFFGELVPGLFLDSAYFDLNYTDSIGRVSGKLQAYHPKLNDLHTEQLTIEFSNETNPNSLEYAIAANGLKQNDSVLFNQVYANGWIDTTAIHFTSSAENESILAIDVGGRLVYHNDSIITHLDTTSLVIYGTPWTLRKTPFPNIVYHNGITEFFYFDLRHENEIFFLEASIGENANKLNLNLNNFHLSNLMPFFAGYDIKLEGTSQGYFDISDRMGFPIIESDFKIRDLQLNDDTLGNLNFTSYQTDLLKVNIKGNLDSGLLNAMDIVGDIDFTKKKSPLDLNITTNKSSIKPFEKYLVDLASDIEGYSTTNIEVTGQLTKPELKGTMRIEDLSFNVDYLQTRYTGFAELNITRNEFLIESAQIFDLNRNMAIVSGGITHQNFVNYLFDIRISDMDNFQLMNTKRKDNDLFYGTAYAKGKLRVSGPIDDILLEIDAKSRKGTNIEIPLDNFETSGRLNYVEFVDFSVDNNAVSSHIAKVSNIRMDFNFEVTNDAMVTLVFDELLGDKIEAAGHGNIRMEINTFGDFNMYGGITIDRGNYLFTAFDFINKYFVVQPGGTMIWDGNPYNATINLEATKREYPVPSTLLIGMLTDEEREQYSEAIPVDCHLQLKGLLFNPDVAFDISFPSQVGLSTSNSAFTTVIDRIKLDPDELNRQVFALLVLGTFIPPSFANPTSGQQYSTIDRIENTGWNSLSDLASSQLNNLLSQLNMQTQIGLDYQYTTQQQRDEIILSLRRKFIDDRFELAFSFDAGATAGTRPYDFNVQYNLSEDGNINVRGFHKNVNDPTLGSINNITTSGLGLFYRYQFDKFRLRRKKVEPVDE